MVTLDELGEVLRARVRRGLDGEMVIEGRRGNIHADGLGFSVFGGFKSARGLNRCRAAFAGFCQMRQEGETEAVWHMEGLPTVEQARSIRYWLKVAKRAEYSLEVLEKKRVCCLAARQHLTRTHVQGLD